MKTVIFSVLLFAAACANTGKAEKYAAQYARENFPGESVVHLKCEASDSDHNGRVRCNVSVRPEGGEPHVEQVECPSDWTPQPLKTTCVGIKR